ncbi:MAG: glucan 1,4-alpha-glucosidase [Acidimicrobiia bacterium]|nr:glucan 1,4-alpha-glucosidase [Acidimicrobiia bacterium]
MRSHHLHDHCQNPAPGGPGIEPRWTRAAKDAVGTAHSSASHVWFTIAHGLITEVYWPTLDRPQLRDLQFLVTDGSTFFHDERRHMTPEVTAIDEDALGYRVTQRGPDDRYRIDKELITDPDLSSVILRVRFSGDPGLRLFLLAAPHLEIAGYGNHGEIAQVGDATVLLASKEDTWLAIGSTIPFVQASVGHVGETDGWQDLAAHYELTHDYDCAVGNIALTGELDWVDQPEFTVALSFASHRHGSITALLQALGLSYDDYRERFIADWQAVAASLLPPPPSVSDGGRLYRRSRSLLLAHEDKLYPGAIIASLSIPWGETKTDHELGGYHLVWSRDMVNSATGLLAAGDTVTPLRALIYLAASQLPDGGFYQNFWISGEPYWHGVQLDEVAFPIILAWKLHCLDGLAGFDPFDMVRRAAGYLIRNGPATPQERWEEAAGYSPSTLASNITALTCAALFMRERGDTHTAGFLQSYADFLECHIETWTVTSQGTLHPDIPRHYIRINPDDPFDPIPQEDPDDALLVLANRRPGDRFEFPANAIVDAGFLELVRYGIRRPDDPLIVDSLAVVDRYLRIDAPAGPIWRRYNHDGYGEGPDGSAYRGHGVGRAWPLLTGERGHYELAAGRDPAPFIRTLERVAHGTGLLPEQVWDSADIPERFLQFGKPTGAAMPLMWAHAEYIKLVRSADDGAVFDRVEEVADRYLPHEDCEDIEVWKLNRQVQATTRSRRLRILAPRPFMLRWSDDGWATTHDEPATPTAVDIWYHDIRNATGNDVRFTFRWEDTGEWHDDDYAVAITS